MGTVIHESGSSGKAPDDRASGKARGARPPVFLAGAGAIIMTERPAMPDFHTLAVRVPFEAASDP